MGKPTIILKCIAALLIIGVVIVMNIKNRWLYEDENTLYYVELNNEILRFERYDYSLGQNQIVGVQKSLNKGKTFKNITDENIIVSMEPKFVFLNEKLGFAISKSDLTKNNNYIGVKVTQNGGKTFTDAKINYDNPNIEVLTVKDVPYYDNNNLKLKCSIYQIKDNHTGYEDIDLIFNSVDDGLTWNLDNNDKFSMSIKENTLTNSGMTLIMKNNTKQTYHYVPQYSLEKYDNGTFTVYQPKETLFWNDVLYNVKAGKIKEEVIEWSYGYDKLKPGKYRLVRYFIAEENLASSRNVSEKYYVEFEIK